MRWRVSETLIIEVQCVRLSGPASANANRGRMPSLSAGVSIWSLGPAGRAGIDTMAGQWPCAGGLPAV